MRPLSFYERYYVPKQKHETVVEDTEVELVTTNRPVKLAVAIVSGVIAIVAAVAISKRKRVVLVEVETEETGNEESTTDGTE